MSSGDTERPKGAGSVLSVTVSLQPDQASALDAWRKRQPDEPSRAAALIILAAKALTTKSAH